MRGSFAPFSVAPKGVMVVYLQPSGTPGNQNYTDDAKANPAFTDDAQAKPSLGSDT